MLTEKQRRFADFFIETGNAAEAARRAGYKEKSARSVGAENLTKPNISAYIKQRLAAMDADRIADAQEVMEVFTRIMRGQENGPDGTPVPLALRLEAGRSIMRRLERIEDREGSADVLAKARTILEAMESVIR